MGGWGGGRGHRCGRPAPPAAGCSSGAPTGKPPTPTRPRERRPAAAAAAAAVAAAAAAAAAVAAVAAYAARRERWLPVTGPLSAGRGRLPIRLPSPPLCTHARVTVGRSWTGGSPRGGGGKEGEGASSRGPPTRRRRRCRRRHHPPHHHRPPPHHPVQPPRPPPQSAGIFRSTLLFRQSAAAFSSPPPHPRPPLPNLSRYSPLPARTIHAPHIRHGSEGHSNALGTGRAGTPPPPHDGRPNHPRVRAEAKRAPRRPRERARHHGLGRDARGGGGHGRCRLVRPRAARDLIVQPNDVAEAAGAEATEGVRPPHPTFAMTPDPSAPIAIAHATQRQLRNAILQPPPLTPAHAHHAAVIDRKVRSAPAAATSPPPPAWSAWRAPGPGRRRVTADTPARRS